MYCALAALISRRNRTNRDGLFPNIEPHALQCGKPLAALVSSTELVASLDPLTVRQSCSYITDKKDSRRRRLRHRRRRRRSSI